MVIDKGKTTNKGNVDSSKAIEERINVYIDLSERGIERCNPAMIIGSIKTMARLSCIDYLLHEGIDRHKAVDINMQTDKKISELTDKFDKKCSCQSKKS